MADRNPPPEGRAQARGRGRRSRLPADPEPGRGPAGPPPAVAATAYPTAVSGGRKNHRGVPRADVETVTRELAATEIGESRGRGSMRRREEGEEHGFVARPSNVTDKKGTSGETIPLLSNYFEVLSKPQWAVQQYHVEFAPNVESPRVRRALISCHKETLGESFLFDGMSDLKMFTRLEKVTELFSQRKTDGENIRITIKHVAELTSGHPELRRLYNVQMRRNLQHLQFVLLGRYFFDKESISPIPEFNLEVWQGVITSIGQQEESLMMLVDTAHKVIRKDTALQVIQEIYKNSRDPKNEVVANLVGTIVMTMYNNRTYRIEDVSWDQKPISEFETRDGGKITFCEYYKKQYDITVRDMQQPLLLCTSKERVVGSRDREQKKVLLIPELCNCTGLTDKMRANFQTMKAIGNVTRVPPPGRVKNLHTFIQRLARNPDVQREMGAWQIRFSNDLVQLNGRVLMSESIIQGQYKYKHDPKKGFSTEMRGKPMHVPMGLNDWIVICTKRDQNMCNDLLMNLEKVCPPMGMQFRKPQVVFIENDRVGSYTQALQERRGAHTNLVVFIVPNNNKNRYDALKKHACVDCPIASQVIVSRTLSKRQMLMSVATKIGIQMNCKLGGEAWAVEIPFKMAVMIVGFDTYHDSLNKNRSAGAFVASLNPNFTKWYSRVSFHGKGGSTELTDHMKIHLSAAFKKYRAVNGRPPSLIIFYRDGVGDGQIRYVKEHELEQIRSTVMELEECGTEPQNMKTQLAFVVVNKRINTRFFAKQVQGYGNPPPGTVVDTVVTRHDRFDFFLVSQSVNQGTVGPTQYNVIEFKCGLKPEHIQRLTYKLTHLYFNWPGTVSVPAPCLYAHKLAFLTGQSLHHEPAEDLSDKLFYL